jgi:hypothetical protein
MVAGKKKAKEIFLRDKLLQIFWLCSPWHRFETSVFSNGIG